MAKTAKDIAQRQQRENIIYPSSDGQPMAETDNHVDLIVHAKSALKAHFADRADSVYVGANNFLFYEEGNPRARISPDTYVVLGRPQEPQRTSYFVWREDDRIPSVVFEFTSRKTRGEDISKKFNLYERLRVPEYFLFDPTGDWLPYRLAGFRLMGQEYMPLEVVDGRLFSERLDLSLVVQGRMMRFYDAKTDRFLPTLTEAEAQTRNAAQRADTEAQRADTEAAARQKLEEELAAMRAELAKLRGQS